VPTSRTPTTRRIAQQTASSDEQRLKLIQSAYNLIAEKGMAGLRIREVASRVGLNHATLLYYFPTKEALIQGVVDYCAHQFDVLQAPNAPTDLTTPRIQLRQRYLADLAYQLREVPELFLVLDELLLYARRDADTRKVLSNAVAYWQQSLTMLFEHDIAQGRFHADLDAKSAALMIISFCQGISLLLTTSPDDISGVIAQFERWFLSISSNGEDK
jgi:AcrR family transcriptional regulator